VAIAEDKYTHLLSEDSEASLSTAPASNICSYIWVTYYFRDGKRQEQNHVILLTSSPMDKYSLTEASSLVAAPVAFQQDPMPQLHDGSSRDESWAGCGCTTHVPHELQTSSPHNARTRKLPQAGSLE
ncbi:hypothetical protein EJB05_49496, partial [Eragrostis curvula]